MPFPLTPGMTKKQFRSQILEHHMPGLCQSDADTAHDYAAIGAFLTRSADVLRALQPLEDKLRQLALENAKAAALQGSVPVQDKSLYEVKENRRKLLTRALQDVETQAGFNQAKSGLLHNESTYGVGSGPEITMTETGRTKDSKRATPGDAVLPQGVPKIIGSIHPTDFMVLLKHGYSFKDVGAESGHGEFTHRLQWYAIILSKDSLNLRKTPIDLYKKMWFQATKGTANVAPHALYMWMALFDNLNSEVEANNFGSVAWSPKTFNNPEFMNSMLTKPSVFGRPDVFDVNDSSNLYVLRKLLGLRLEKRKRGFDATTAYHQKKMVDGEGNKTVIGSRNAPGQTKVEDLKNVVVWIEEMI